MKDQIIDADFSEIEVEDYVDDYSEDGLWGKIKDNVTAIGISLIYKALQLQRVLLLLIII